MSQYSEVRKKLAELKKPAKPKLPPRQGPAESVKEQLERIKAEIAARRNEIDQ